MSTVEDILFHSPWIPYNSKFLRSRISLSYPENVVFTAQFLKHLSQSDVYKHHRYAEKPKTWDLQHVDWTKAVIAFDKDLQLRVAPDPVRELVQLERRLNYPRAAAVIFNPFRFFPLSEVFRHQWLGLVLIFVFYILSALVSIRYTGYSLALPNKSLIASRDRRP